MKTKPCANCGALFRPLDGRYKYCSDECAKEAQRAQCREHARRRYVLHHEAELERSRRYYTANKEEIALRKKAKRKEHGDENP